MQESLKPIEAGCLALIIWSHHGNAGKVVRVVKYLGLEEFFLTFGKNKQPAWEIAEELPSIWGTSSKAIESQLMRIDGFEGENESLETEQINEECLCR